MSAALTQQPGANPFHYTHTENFAAILEGLNATLFVSTYQAGKLVVVRSAGGRVSTLMRTFEQAMGLAVDPHRLAIGTRWQIWNFLNATDVARQIKPEGQHDACYIPRLSHVTGDIRCHELAWAGDELWFVNTRFSCLCTLDANYSFVPKWKPPFVTDIAPEDRCHLNGLEVVGNQPAYVTALGETDVAEGWREGQINGGCLIDVRSNERIVGDLCMPHSPRAYDEKLWLLESGRGRLLLIDPNSGITETVVELPGYARGLSFMGPYAFVGLSKIRETSIFSGMPITQKMQTLKCGVWVVDIRSGAIVAFLDFDAGVEEIFDVRIVSGIRHPAVIGLQKDLIHGTFVVPQQTESSGEVDV